MIDQNDSRNKSLSQQFQALLGTVETIGGVKSVDIDDNNGASFQVAVVLDMQKFGGNYDWACAYGIYDETKKKVLPRVVREVKKAFRSIEGCTVTGHDTPKAEYDRYREDYGGRRIARKLGYAGRVLMVHCHWYPENERVSIQELMGTPR